MNSSFGRGANWRLTRLSSPFCLSVALLVIAVPSHAQVLTCSSIPLDKQTFCSKSKAGASTYCAAYAHIVANIQISPGCFWRQVTKMGDQLVPTGLGIWNTSGTKGPGIVSEAMGYAMILAALYDDRATFNKLSLTVQAGIAYNQSQGNPRLFPWYWTPNAITTEYSPATDPPNSPNLGFDSASDADINIALAYVYADKAKTVYGWSDPTLLPTNFIPNSPNFNTTPTYQMMAQSYIAAIRQYDFSKTDTPDNQNVLADGYVQAGETFSKHNWHPDYSDIRAYQLFKTYYDTAGKAFWDTAISTTKISWKAIFNFGSSDPRNKPDFGSENATPNMPIDPTNSWVMLSNPTYQTLQASSVDYSKVKAFRPTVGDPPNGMNGDLYTADSQRLPIRLLNYLNATGNSGDTDMLGIASANLTALGTSYTKANYQALADRVSIGHFWPSNGGYIQNRTAAGLLAYASNNTLSYGGPPPPTGMKSIYMDLLGKFGNGNNGKPAPPGGATINMDLDNSFDDSMNHFGVDGFNALLSLWALTVSQDGQTPLQKYILSQ